MTVNACAWHGTLQMPCSCALKQSLRIKTSASVKGPTQMLPDALVTKNTLDKASDGGC